MFFGRDWRTALRIPRRSANLGRRGLRRWCLLSQTNADSRLRPHVGIKSLSMSMAARLFRIGSRPASHLQLNANDVVEEAVKLVRQEGARRKLAPTMIYALVLLGRSPQW